MSSIMLDAAKISTMFLSGAANLDAHKELINELNVFPVPDGDTGTNMTMTIMSAADAVMNLDEMNIKTLSKAISGGSLRGARGNSGVILSQLFRGFTKTLKGKEAIDIALMADAADRAVETAYKAVMKPKEGTILTVAKGVAEKIRELSEKDGITMEEIIHQAILYGNEVLEKTPEMLPVLKEAGVVDSGGKGLMAVLEGAYLDLIGKPVAFGSASEDAGNEGKEEKKIHFTYNVSFIVKLEKTPSDKELNALREFMIVNGEDVLLVSSDNMLKVQTRTDKIGDLIRRSEKLGQLMKVHIENVLFDHEEALIKEAENLDKESVSGENDPAQDPSLLIDQSGPRKNFGFIAVCAGNGFKEIYAGLETDYVISGGQTMNPSTDDFLAAIRLINANNIFVFPNNGNIILAANQARDLTEDKNIIVIPTKTVPQGITAMINFNPDDSAENNESTMKEMIGTVKTSQITYSIRDTVIDDIEIHKGDIMAVGDKGIICAGSNIMKVARKSVASMVSEDSELISVYYGENFSEEEAGELSQSLSEEYPDCDVEINEGGQPVYYCIISVE